MSSRDSSYGSIVRFVHGKGIANAKEVAKIFDVSTMKNMVDFLKGAADVLAYRGFDPFVILSEMVKRRAKDSDVHGDVALGDNIVFKFN